MARRRRKPHKAMERPLSLGGSHWRADGAAKATYMSASEAQIVANQLWVEERIDLNVYQCDFCGGWHMGKSADDVR